MPNPTPSPQLISSLPPLSHSSSSPGANSDPLTSSSPNPRKRPSHTMIADEDMDAFIDPSNPAWDESLQNAHLKKSNKPSHTSAPKRQRSENSFSFEIKEQIESSKKDTETLLSLSSMLGLGKGAPKKKATPKTTIKYDKSVVGHCSLSKKDFGDAIKDCFSLEKYSLQRTRIDIEMDVPFFRSFFDAGKGVQITPSVYDDKTAVIVADMSCAQAGELFGVSKVKGGNRCVTVYMQSMCVVLYPARKRATAWVTV